jgi:hypothetical protein
LPLDAIIANARAIKQDLGAERVSSLLTPFENNVSSADISDIKAGKRELWFYSRITYEDGSGQHNSCALVKYEMSQPNQLITDSVERPYNCVPS